MSMFDSTKTRLADLLREIARWKIMLTRCKRRSVLHLLTGVYADRCLRLEGAWSVVQHVPRRFRQPVSRADVGEGSAGVGVAGEVLEVDDVGAPLAGGG